MRAVIVSVRYADFLDQSLPAWRKFLPKGSLVVATTESDVLTHRIAEKHKTPVYCTTAWTEADPTCHVGTAAKFNKPLGLDRALGLTGEMPPPDLGELCVSLDADVIPFGRWDEASYEPGIVYGLYRYKCDTHQDLVAHRRGLRALDAYAWMHNKTPAGYCQIFRYHPGVRFGSYPSAGDYDREFCHQFERSEMRSDCYVLHLGARGGYWNWRRRQVPLWDARPKKAKPA